MPTKKENEYQKVRQDFLTSFVKTLILNSLTKEEIERIKIERKKFEQSIENVAQKIHPMLPRGQPQMTPSMINSITSSPIPMPTFRPPNLPPGQRMETISLGKLTQMLLDPSVLSIECPGAGKYVLVNRSGTIQTARLTLTQQEIDNVVEEFSEKTRIPFGIGLFKAAFQDLIMTAVISEYVGTRFIIQKRTPFQ